jgi:uncharacterized protein (DUF1786 family)
MSSSKPSTYHIHAAISSYSNDGIEHTKIYPDHGHFCYVLVVAIRLEMMKEYISVGRRRIKMNSGTT